MPTAYVKKMADKHNISVGAAEEKWERAKQAAGEKFKHGSKRFWPYVMGIFKRMLGEQERMTFSDYLLLEAEVQQFPKNIKLAGPYVAVKVADDEHHVSYQVKKLLSDDVVPLRIFAWFGRSDDDTGGMWTFRPIMRYGEQINDRLKDEINHVKENMSSIGVRNVKAFTDWARRHMQHLIDQGVVDEISIVQEGLTRVDEGAGLSIPKGVATLPKRIILGVGGYYLELKEVKPVKATFEVKRMMGEAPGITLTISKRKQLSGRLGTLYMLQAHGEPLARLSWDDRSDAGTVEEVKPFDYQTVRQFVRSVIEKAGLLSLDEDKKEDGVKKSYLDFKGSSKKKELKKEMKREIKRFSKLSHKDKAAYPDDWTADQKYKAELKKKGKTLPKSEHTKEFERRYGK